MTMWAVVKRGKIVHDERKHLPLLFKTRGEACGYIWEQGETVRRVTITIETD